MAPQLAEPEEDMRVSCQSCDNESVSVTVNSLPTLTVLASLYLITLTEPSSVPIAMYLDQMMSVLTGGDNQGLRSHMPSGERSMQVS